MGRISKSLWIRNLANPLKVGEDLKVFREFGDIFVERPQGIAIGNFDGLHKGHIMLLKTLVEKCKAKGIESLVYTFSNHPRGHKSSEEGPKRLISLENKIKLIESVGIDNLVMLPFDDSQKNIGPEAFIKDVLVEKLKAKQIVVGDDFRFGKMAAGNVALLKDRKDTFGYELEIMSQLKDQGTKISSTYIRDLLAKGEITKANELLGRYFMLSGNVIDGRKVGRTLGFPTANIENCPKMTLLKSGVYLTQIIINEHKYLSVTNVGNNPTFEDRDYSVETHIMNFEEDIYGIDVKVEFLHRLRDEMKFDSLDALISAINNDIHTAKVIYNELYV